MKKVFDNIDDLWLATLDELLTSIETPSRVGNTKEMIGYQVILTKINKTFLLNPRRKLSPIYACAEFLWYLKHTKSIKMIKTYAPQYEKFAEDDEAHGAYGWRLYNNISEGSNLSQLSELIDLLQADPDSRQAIVTMWNANDLVSARQKEHKDYPCTLSMQFLIRDGQLNLIVTMRSNDAWLGLPYDIFAFTCIQRLIAQAVGCECGTYIHQVGSEHLYEKNWKAASEAIDVGSRMLYDVFKLTHDWENKSNRLGAVGYHRDTQIALCAEGRYRTGLNGTAEHHQLTNNRMMFDVVTCCARKFEYEDTVYSPMLRKGLEQCSS